MFSRPHIDRDFLLASACKPTDFQAVEIGGERYWDGGYMGNPALDPLFNAKDATAVDDIVLVQINPLRRSDGWPITATAIADRLNQVTFNASLMLEVNTIHRVNKLLEQSPPDAVCHQNYRRIRLHTIANQPFMQTLGVMSQVQSLLAIFEAAVRRRTSDGGSLAERARRQARSAIKLGYRGCRQAEASQAGRIEGF
ncbi:patatin-like phospholipase family protein [Bradyrhizobium sp. CCBAU 53380]|uniref:patatin-like phospholipase family protein n=1 Tax=Bradyrhizobium sp. CCBAU 53380 TaxID=1325117 RepID=UPI002302721C|nr:hypothetical protein [Bradyrhizobium sp. CCBAU 53380]